MPQRALQPRFPFASFVTTLDRIKAGTAIRISLQLPMSRHKPYVSAEDGVHDLDGVFAELSRWLSSYTGLDSPESHC
jgi:hypothetical protein